MNYQVSEIYRAVQGEGWHTGLPCTLVRLQGCNLRCDFCDTPYAQDPKGGMNYTLAQVMCAVEENHHKGDILLITGGEPTQQILRPLILALRRLGPVHIETNGTSRDTLGPTSAILDWITVSPKPPVPCTASSFYHADEIKWLVGGPEDVSFLKCFLQRWRGTFKTDKKICVQPISLDPARILRDGDSRATEVAYQACLDYGWRLSLQTHKLIGVK